MSNDSSPFAMPPRQDFLASVTSGLALVTAFGLPRPAGAQGPALKRAPADASIASLGIYPPIGISRVGSSPESFSAPQVPGRVPPGPDFFYKDAEGRVKKQMQRFFIFAFDDQGRVIREITADEATLEWTVRVANTKAAWYGFNNPMDLSKTAPGIPAPRRNASLVDPNDREDMLVIDSGEVSITGSNENTDGTADAHRLQGSF
jgi:hypothetical protein